MKEFVTTAGEKIEYGPISLDDWQLAQNAVRKEFELRGEPIEPPTYKIPLELEGKDKFEEHPHTAETIKDASVEEKIAWAAHLGALDRLGDEIQHRTGLVLLDVIKFEMPEDGKWIERRKRLFDEDVPEDEEERRSYYLNKVLLKTPADKNGLMEAIFDCSMTGAPEEVIKAYKDLFRRAMEDQGREAARLIETIQGPGQEVVLQPVDATDDGSKGMGIDALGIQGIGRKEKK